MLPQRSIVRLHDNRLAAIAVEFFQNSHNLLAGFGIHSTCQQLIGSFDDRVAALNLAHVPDDAPRLLISEGPNDENQNRWHHGEGATL